MTKKKAKPTTFPDGRPLVRVFTAKALNEIVSGSYNWRTTSVDPHEPNSGWTKGNRGSIPGLTMTLDGGNADTAARGARIVLALRDSGYGAGQRTGHKCVIVTAWLRLSEAKSNACIHAGCTRSYRGTPDDMPPSWFAFGDPTKVRYCEKHATEGRRIKREVEAERRNAATEDIELTAKDLNAAIGDELSWSSLGDSMTATVKGLHALANGEAYTKSLERSGYTVQLDEYEAERSIDGKPFCQLEVWIGDRDVKPAKALKLNAKALFAIIGADESVGGTFPLRWSACGKGALFAQVRGPDAPARTLRIDGRLRAAGYFVEYTSIGDMAEIVVALDRDSHWAALEGREKAPASPAYVPPDQAANLPVETAPIRNWTKSSSSQIAKRRAHPACDAFPMMTDDEIDRLAEDIKANGLHHPLELWRDEKGEDVTLDGRNRELACERAGVTPRFEYYKGADPIARVISLNLRRRHMTTEQRAMIGARLANMQQGGARRGDAVAAGVSQKQAAAQLAVSERTLRDAKRVIEIAPPAVQKLVDGGKLAVSAALEVAKLPASKQKEIVERVEKQAGEMKAGKVVSLARHAAKRETVEKLNKRVTNALPRGPFSRWVVDWPWKYDNAGDEGARTSDDYPGLTVDHAIRMADEIKKNCADDAVLFFWVTNHFLDDAYAIVKAWGFEPVSFVTWAKKTKTGKRKAGVGTWPRGETEHFVIAKRGNPVHTLNESTTLFDGVVRERARKPEEFWSKYAEKCGGPGVEMFAREPRKGFVAWGAEVDKFTKRSAA